MLSSSSVQRIQVDLFLGCISAISALSQLSVNRYGMLCTDWLEISKPSELDVHLGVPAMQVGFCVTSKFTNTG